MNTHRKQLGFTFVELMTVLTIIGIIAVIAIPQYQAYTIRAKATELIHLASNAKSQMSEYILTYNRYPETAQKAGINPVSSNVLEELTINNSGTIILTSNEDELGADLTLMLQATNHGSSVSWKCSALGNIDFAPPSCR